MTGPSNRLDTHVLLVEASTVCETSPIGLLYAFGACMGRQLEDGAPSKARKLDSAPLKAETYRWRRLLVANSQHAAMAGMLGDLLRQRASICHATVLFVRRRVKDGSQVRSVVASWIRFDICISVLLSCPIDCKTRIQYHLAVPASLAILPWPPSQRLMPHVQNHTNMLWRSTSWSWSSASSRISPSLSM